MTNSHSFSATLGRLSGVAEDTANPDEYSEDNSGFKLRQNIYCEKDNSEATSAKIVHLKGPLASSVSSNPWPIPSEIDIQVRLTLIVQTLIMKTILTDQFVKK